MAGENATMSRQHFEFIARVLAEAKPYAGTEEYGLWDRLVRRFASELASTNPQFRESQFLFAAGIK